MKTANSVTMVQGMSITMKEFCKILESYPLGKSITSISTEVNRCRSAIRRIIQSEHVQGGQQRRGARRKVVVRSLKTSTIRAACYFSRTTPPAILQRIRRSALSIWKFEFSTDHLALQTSTL